MVEPVAEAWHIRLNGPLSGRCQRQRIQERGDQAHGGGPARAPSPAPSPTPRRSATPSPPTSLTSLGVGVEIDGDAITVHPVASPGAKVPLEFTGLNRIPILLLGPLLARNHEAFVPLVGGDRTGQRPVDFHIGALEALGVEIEVTPEGISAQATRLRGAPITLPYPSVGATESVLLTAVLADGRTVLRNAALEPEGHRTGAVPPAHGSASGSSRTGASSSRASSVRGAPEPARGATGWRRSPAWWPGS